MFSEELRRRAIAPSGGAPTRRICSGEVLLSTTDPGKNRRCAISTGPPLTAFHRGSQDRIKWVQCNM